MNLQLKSLAAIAVLCTVLPACRLFEVRNTSGDVNVADAMLTTDLMAAKRDTIAEADSLPLRPKAVADATQFRDTALLPPGREITVGNTRPDSLVQFAQTLTGVPYVYAATSPRVGFDCSGFITYVFNHFQIAVPRSSIDFTDVGKTVAVPDARPGDLILFTGTNAAERHVGHMGLVVSNSADSLRFIHSSSGKAMGVTTTALNEYYKKRFVRVARIFPQNGL